MTTVEGPSTDVESIVSNDNRSVSCGADRAVDPAVARSVLGGGGGGAQPLGGDGRSVHSGPRSIMSDDQPVDNNDVRRSFRREIGRPIFDNSRPVIVGKKITNRT